MKTSVFSVLLFCAFAFFQQTLHAQTASDEQSVRAFIDKAMQDWFAGNADKVASAYSENAVSIDWTGRQLNGRAAILEDISRVFTQEKPDPANFKMTVTEVRMLAPTVAVAVSDLSGKSVMDGNTIEWQGRSTMVLSRKTGAWQVEFEQNTPVMPPQGK
ncbi:MAG: SgcJ/EcaC family oxidoreductase [Thermoanaerobaculia bacterium]|nr:SgcJ/EcaC family oxidoreductase [Thermoanaerobaculia bacterium]